MKSLFRLGLFEIVFFLLAILVGYGIIVLNDTTLTWRSLGTPPGMAIRIVEGNLSAVRAETSSGETYFCQFKDSGPCWVHNNQPMYVQTTPSWIKNYGEPPPMPLGVVDTKKSYSASGEYIQVLSIFVVTKTGEVYV